MESKTAKLKKKRLLLAVPIVLILFALFMPVSNQMLLKRCLRMSHLKSRASGSFTTGKS